MLGGLDLASSLDLDALGRASPPEQCEERCPRDRGVRVEREDEEGLNGAGRRRPAWNSGQTTRARGSGGVRRRGKALPPQPGEAAGPAACRWRQTGHAAPPAPAVVSSRCVPVASRFAAEYLLNTPPDSFSSSRLLPFETIGLGNCVVTLCPRNQATDLERHLVCPLPTVLTPPQQCVAHSRGCVSLGGQQVVTPAPDRAASASRPPSNLLACPSAPRPFSPPGDVLAKSRNSRCLND